MGAAKSTEKGKEEEERKEERERKGEAKKDKGKQPDPNVEDTKPNRQTKAEAFNEYIGLVDEQNKIREFFRPEYSPYHFISYKSFLLNFPFHPANFSKQNLNIIDTNLRYRLFIRNQMARYKWLSILAATPFIYRSTFLMIAIPYATVNIFDYYFQGFFIWLHQSQPLINMREQFATKLTKISNIQRRVDKYKKLQSELKRTKQQEEHPQQILEPPLRYIKFGDYTDHVFHTNTGGIEQSSILQTSLFHTYMILQSVTLSDLFSGVLRHFIYLGGQFLKYRQDKDRDCCLMNQYQILNNPVIKQEDKFSVETNIELTIKQFIELWVYMTKGVVILSNFKIAKWTNLSAYNDFLDPQKYNVKTNAPDLICYWSVFLAPKMIKWVFRRGRG